MNHQPLPQRKRTRLRPEAYAEPGAVCSITIATRQRAPVFSNPDFAHACVDLIGAIATDTGVAVHAYALMPDHAHLLLSPSPSSSIVDFVREFKGKSTRLSWQHGCSGALWQQGFYDHFLRNDEEVRRVAAYILGNPVRKGLAAEWREYPFCGSLAYDL